MRLNIFVNHSLQLFFFLFISRSLNGAPLEINVSADSAILINADTGAILFEKNAHAEQFPASITKIATALYTLHTYGDKLDREATAEHDAVASLSKEAKKRANYSMPAYWLEPGATHIGIKRGELLSLNDLLYGMMISSGNDASNVIAQYIGGTIPAFMDDLNSYLKELGTLNTHFTNPHGLHHPNHITTAHDMALITKEAMRNSQFCEIVKTIRYTRPKTNLQQATTLIQTNRLLRKGKLYYDKAIGVKTGWTSDAQHTLVAAAECDGRRLIAVLIKVKEREQIFQEAKSLFEAAFKQPIVRRVLLKAGPQRYTLKHPSSSKKIETYLTKDVCVDFYPAEEPDLKCSLKWQNLELPIYKGDVVGEMIIAKGDGTPLQIVPLLAKEEISLSWLGNLKNRLSNYFFTDEKNIEGNSQSSHGWKVTAFLGSLFFLTFTLFSMRRKSNRS